MPHVHVFDLAGVCTGPGPCNTAPIGQGPNWVTKTDPAKGLHPYLRAIVHALIRSGHSEQDSVRLAIGIVKRWARGEGKVTKATRARAAQAVAEWEALKAKDHGRHLTGDDRMAIQLAALDVSRLDKAALIRMAKMVETWPEERRGPAKAAIAKRAKALGMEPDGDGDYDYDVPRLNSTPADRTSTMMAASQDGLELTRDGKLRSPKDLHRAYANLHKLPLPLQTRARAMILKRARTMASPAMRHLAADGQPAVELGGGPSVAERRALLARGQALPPLPGSDRPRYPISDADSLHKAVKAVGRGKTGHPALRAYIKRVAAKLGLSSLIPEDWK